MRRKARLNDKRIEKLKTKNNNRYRFICEKCGKEGFMYLVDETHFVCGKCKFLIKKQNEKFK